MTAARAGQRNGGLDLVRANVVWNVRHVSIARPIVVMRLPAARPTASGTQVRPYWSIDTGAGQGA